MDKIKKDILSLVTEDSRLSAASMAAMLGVDKKTVEKAVEELEESGVIVKYTAIVNEDLVEEETVEALIEVKVTPQRGHGFDSIAAEIGPSRGKKSVPYERRLRPRRNRGECLVKGRFALRFGVYFHIRQRNIHRHALHIEEVQGGGRAYAGRGGRQAERAAVSV